MFVYLALLFYRMSTISPYLLPPNEAERLRSLHSYDVLPSLNEPVFDEFVALTARIFSLPISLIALVDEDEVHYPANYGMPGHHRQPREEALCATAIMEGRAVVYRDLLTEESPVITPRAAAAAQANNLQFYAAAPLRMPNQCNIGTLCVIDRHPRVFSDDEQHLLEELANVVSQALVVRHNYLSDPDDSGWGWKCLREQLQEEVQALTALVRYLFTRHGTQVPVPADLLTQVERRLHDLRDLLTESRE